jgi:hypothetical protein
VSQLLVLLAVVLVLGAILICPLLTRLDKPKRRPSNAKMRAELREVLKTMESTNQGSPQ